MKIDATPVGSHPAVKPMKALKPVDDEKPIEAPPSTAVQKTESEEKTRGVIRLLQEGHFKGVADVRLRINFHDEIQALESEHLKTVAAGDFESLNKTVQDQIAVLKDSGLLSPEQITALDDFLASLQQAQSEFLNEHGVSIQSLIESFQAKLNELMALLEPPAPAPPVEAELPEELAALSEEPADPESSPAALPEELTEPQAAPAEEPAAEVIPQPPVEEAPAPEPVIYTEPQPAEPSPLQLLVTAFQESIQQAFDGLQSGLTGTSVLPPLSEPSGNGNAYAKFLAIYESMQVDTVPETLPIEESGMPEETPILEEGVVAEEPESLSELV